MKIHHLYLTAALTSSMFTFAVTSAHAATDIPGSADAGRVQENLKQSLPSVTRQAPLRVEGGAAFTAPAGAEKITFVLSSIQFDGVSVYTPLELESLYADKIGKTISLADLYTIAAELTRKYRNEGYILTQVVVPPQTIDGGHAKLRIVEGTIDQIHIEGDGAQGSSASVIKLYLSRLEGKKILSNADLENVLLLINDLPGVSARSVLSPSKSKVGASDLTIFITRDPFDANIGLNNNGSRFLGQWQMQGSLGLNSLLGHNERLGAQFAYAPSNQGFDHELIYGEITASLPVGKWGTKIEVNAGASNTIPGHTLTEFDINGQSRFMGINIRQPLIRSRELNISTNLGMGIKSTDTKSNIDVTRRDNVTDLKLAGHMDFVDTIFSAAVTGMNLELSHGLSIFGASDANLLTLSRPDGDPSFTKLTADITRLERLTNNLSVQLATKGQLSNGAQLSSEEFGIGGATNIGRGYDPSELVGDDGLAGSVELHWSPSSTPSWLNAYSVYGFYDIGKVWNDDATSAGLKVQSLASTGVGLNANIDDATQAGFMIAAPLTREVSAENDSDPRFYFSLTRDF